MKKFGNIVIHVYEGIYGVYGYLVFEILYVKFLCVHVGGRVTKREATVVMEICAYIFKFGIFAVFVMLLLRLTTL